MVLDSHISMRVGSYARACVFLVFLPPPAITAAEVASEALLAMLVGVCEVFPTPLEARISKRRVARLAQAHVPRRVAFAVTPQERFNGQRAHSAMVRGLGRMLHGHHAL